MAPQTIELPPIVVSKNQAALAAPVRARLIEVNRTHQFIVIDKGSGDGVRIGMTFEILRGGGMVARAVAVRVRGRLAACDLVSSRSGGRPQVGDVVVQLRP